MAESTEHSDRAGPSTTPLALISLTFMLFFLGASIPLGIYAYESDNELIQAMAILFVPFSLWGWISFLRKALRTIDLTLWSLGTTKVSLAAGFVTIALLVVYSVTKSNGVWLAIEIGLCCYGLALVGFNFRYTRSILLTLNVTVVQLWISALAVLFAFWLYVRLQPTSESIRVDSETDEY